MSDPLSLSFPTSLLTAQCAQKLSYLPAWAEKD